MISAPRIVVVSVVFFLTGLFYYSSANSADYTISARNPTAASAMKGAPQMDSALAEDVQSRTADGALEEAPTLPPR